MTQVSHMTLDDLKTGMIVTMRNGVQFTVIRNMVNLWHGGNDILIYSTTKGNAGWMPFDAYNSNMTYMMGDNDWDIVKVEATKHPFGFMDVDYHVQERTLIWKENHPIKLTVAEIEARLGYRVEIVSDDNKED